MCDWPENAKCKPYIMNYAEEYFLNNLHRQTELSLPTRTNKTGRL